MKHFLPIAVLFLGIIASAGPVTVTYSCYITNINKQPRSLNGQLVTFRLYEDSASSTPIWVEQHGVIAPNGFISVALGSITPLPMRQIGSVSSLWIEMKIFTDPALPRQKIATSFFAVAANYADSARHAVMADSAKGARHAVISDTAQYARRAEKADTAFKAGVAGQSSNADSLGGIAAVNYSRKSDVPAIKVLNAFRSDTALYALNVPSRGYYSGSIQVPAVSGSRVEVVRIPTSNSGIFVIYVYGEASLGGATYRKATMLIPGTDTGRRAWVDEEIGYYDDTQVFLGLIQPLNNVNNTGAGLEGESHSFQITYQNKTYGNAILYWHVIQIAP